MPKINLKIKLSTTTCMKTKLEIYKTEMPFKYQLLLTIKILTLAKLKINHYKITRQAFKTQALTMHLLLSFLVRFILCLIQRIQVIRDKEEMLNII